MSPEQQPQGGALARVVSRVVEAQIALCEIIVVALAVFVSLDALLRWGLSWSFLVIDEVGGYALVALTFLGMSIALHEGALFRVEALYDRLTPEMRARLQLLFDLASLAFSVLLLWQVYGLVSRSFARGVVAPTILLTPLWIPQTIMVIGGATLVLVLVLQVRNGLSGLLKRRRGH